MLQNLIHFTLLLYYVLFPSQNFVIVLFSYLHLNQHRMSKLFKFEIIYTVKLHTEKLK